MRAFLMDRDRDFDINGALPLHWKDLVNDLELNILFDAMAQGDKFLFEAGKIAVLSGINNDLYTILYRQNILKDCMKNNSVVRDMYDIALAAIESVDKHYWDIFSKYPPAILHRSVEALRIFVTMLKKLRNIAELHADRFESEGFMRLFVMLKRELDDDYFSIIRNHLEELKFRNGVLISAHLGKGNRGVDYVLRKGENKKVSWVKRILMKDESSYTFALNERDESGARAVSELNKKGINLVANAVAQSTDHIFSFFKMLRTELAFYIGCLNLHEQLLQAGGPTSFPLPVIPGERKHFFRDLYDPCLALTIKKNIVKNTMNGDKKDLVIITGANQGGKSTFMRSIGQSQLMMQCGMFVPAEFFSASICDGLFTHYEREEDADMKSGKLDEELGRMSSIVDAITPDSLVLLNESFAATNEREGSEIARQITQALLETGIKIFFVTHLYEFAHTLLIKNNGRTLFLRPERKADGERTFKLIEGEPLETSHAEDLYNKIFANSEAYLQHQMRTPEVRGE